LPFTTSPGTRPDAVSGVHAPSADASEPLRITFVVPAVSFTSRTW
jgi:hypothetical protein